ncbi:Rhodanese-like domain containing protein, partial [Aphelenchoides avenae]
GNVDYQKAHIPSAVHFNLDVGTFPSWNERESLYPPELFEQYVQRLGINANEHIVVYSRGPLGGMLYAARVWSLFRIYGHNRVSILNGGFEAWQAVNLPVDDAAVEITPGTWTARFDPTLLITYEEMTTPASDGYCVLSRLYWYNFLDVRTRNEFFGYAGNRVDGARGNHIPGMKSFPASELVQPDGRFVPIPEIKKRLQHIAYAPEKQSIVAGTSPEEASMVLVALALMGDLKARLFNGGIEEIRIRAPQLISE